MKKLGVVIVITLFLMGFAMANSLLTSKAVEKIDYPSTNNLHNNSDQINTENNKTGVDIQSSIRDRLRNRLTDEQINKIFIARNKIRAFKENGTCPDNCTCTGSVIKCELNNGTREMTIVAGNSGNIIIQIKGINATTNVTLYKSDDGKIYAVLKNNETKVIRMLPDQVRERIRENLSRELENENITLNENGTYDYSAEKNATLLFFFHVKERVDAQIDSETGQIKNIKNPWWAFMAKDESQPIVGASCGTVTPGQNDACCQSKEYDFWNVTASECQFNSSG